MSRDSERWSGEIANAVNNLGRQVNSLQRFQGAYEVDKQIEAIQQLNEKLLSHSMNYTNLILVAGYAGFFAFWSTLADKIPKWIFALSGFLILLSLTLFIVWEITKMVWQAIQMRRVSNTLEGQRGPKTVAQYEAAYATYQKNVTRVWVFFLVPTIVFGMGAALLLMGYFCLDLWVLVSSPLSQAGQA